MDRNGWTYKKLGDVASFINGYPFKPEQWKDRGFPIIRIQNLNNPEAPYNYYDGEVPDRVKIKDGDLLISWSASLGTYIWQGGDAYLNQHIFKVLFDKLDIDKMFLKYAVSSKLKEMAALVHGATMKHIVKKDFDNTTIPYPPLNDQMAIVSELDSIYDSITMLKQQVKDLDALALSLFYDMFGEPIENPKHWPIVKLGTIAEPTIGLTYKPENVVDNNEGTIVLRSSNIQESELDFDDIVRVNIPIKEEKFVREGDILMCSRNGSIKLVGKVAMIKGLTEKMSFGAFMTIIRSNYNPYLFAYFKTPAFREHMNLGKTSTVNQVTVNMLKNISLPLPSESLQKTFATKIASIEDSKVSLKAQIIEMQNLLASRMQYWFD